MADELSRTYVALCRNADFMTFYFKKFVLPEEHTNCKDMARWYLLMELCFTGWIETILTFAEYQDISDLEPKDFPK